jgi:hypothetical protein
MKLSMFFDSALRSGQALVCLAHSVGVKYSVLLHAALGLGNHVIVTQVNDLRGESLHGAMMLIFEPC